MRARHPSRLKRVYGGAIGARVPPLTLAGVIALLAHSVCLAQQCGFPASAAQNRAGSVWVALCSSYHGFLVHETTQKNKVYEV